MDARLINALKAWRDRYPGESSASKRLHGWLLDAAPGERRLAKALAAVDRLELFRHLEPLSGKQLDPFTFRRLVDALIAEEGLSTEISEAAVLVWAQALDVQAPDAASLRGPVDRGAVTASLDATRALHLSLVSSDLRPISGLRVESISARPLSDLVVSVWLSGVEVGSTLRSTTWTGGVDRLKPRQVALLDQITPVVAPQALHELKASAVGRWWIEVKQKNDVLLRTFQDVEVMAPRQFAPARLPLATLAAFVQPNDAVVAELVGEAAGKVSDADARPPPLKALDALKQQVDALNLTLERASPDSIAGPRALITAGRASYLELQLMLAACLEHAGLSPLLVWASTGPALGLWTAADRPSLTETDDPVMLARLAEAGTLVLVPIGDHVLRLSPDETHATLTALDLASARRAGVLPLPAMVLDDGRALKADEARQRLLELAALTHTRTGLLLPGAWSAKLGRGSDSGGAEAPPRLQGWKRRLLDLTLNNPLLNSRPRVTSVPLLVADLAVLEDALASGRHFGLLARPNPQTSGPVTPELMAAAMTSGSLLVDLAEGRVAIQAKNAVRVHKEALEEGGVHTLFLTLGMLEWFDAATPTVPRLAPLLLVPVQMRRSRHGHYELKKADADAEFNAALLELLRREYGVEIPALVPLPADASGVDVNAVLSAVRAALAKTPATSGWTVKDAAQVAPIAFAGFRMWRDLDHQASDLMRHPLVKRLAVGGDTGEVFEPLDAAQLDQQWHPKDVLCPLDADASQLSAVLSAAAGKSLVLEGPPGTGKSQTIANLVAQCVASGKSVLFVAQKRAALEVVQARLDAVGLGPFLLELHSKKASKPEFIAQLRTAADFRAKKPAKEWATEAAALADARSELNALVKALHVRRPPELSVFECIAELERRRATPRLDGAADASRGFDAQWRKDAQNALGDLAPTFARLAPGWKALDAVRATEWPATKKAQLDVALDELTARAGTLRAAATALAEWFPGLDAANADTLELVDRILADVEATPRPRAELLKGGDDELQAWLAQVEQARSQAAALSEAWAPALLAQPIELWHGKVKQWMNVFLLGWLVLALTVRWGAKAVAKAAVPPTAKLVADLEQALGLRKVRATLAEGSLRAVALLGPHPPDAWDLPKVELDQARRLVDWSRAFRSRTTRFPRAQELAAHGGPEKPEAVTAFRAAWAAYDQSRRGVVALLDLSGGWTKPAEPAHLEASIANAARIKAAAYQLREWGQYRRSRDACLALGLKKAVKALEDAEVPGPELVERFTHGWYAWWLEQRTTEDRALAGFDGAKLDNREQRFAEADIALRDLARGELQSRIVARMPKLDQGAPPTSQAGILLRQFNRRVGFASPRQLFSECAGLIRQLKPCVLMSPQSVAQYLDPSQPPFDVVVFDEASQVPTHEAIGAIARGKQVVVVGDSRQLPPTSFFLGQAKEEDSEDDDVLTELDSILEECSASGLPSLRLGWHYRSRHPSLIAFSNARYYAGQLQVLPAAEARAPHLGVSRVLVKGHYDRGRTATNRVEAEALVADVLRRLRDPSENKRSLAVVTFSRAQQGLIEDLLDDARELDPQLEPFFDPEKPEPLIVKNLENIQGDERDVVLFSIGYGPDSLGRMTANLGPLGQLGGERRLNVAVTRAREQLVVFVSFEPSQLNLAGSTARGLHDLKGFLESAASAGDVVMGGDDGSAGADDATLQAAVRTGLEAKGYTVDLNVGVGRYRLDLAVRESDSAERYLLGIELDGARYAGTDTARDRERLRREALHSLGWKHLARVRAIDWRESSDRVVAALVARLERAKVEVPLAARPVAAPEPPLPEPIPLPIAAEPEPDFGLDEHVYTPAVLPVTAATFAWTKPDVIEAVGTIVAAEGPVSERLVGRRVADAWSLKRSPPSFGSALAGILSKLSPDRRFTWREGFLWPLAVKPDVWREYRVADPAKQESRRDIEDICLEEIANTADAMLKRYGTMPRDELARAVAKRFGYRGLTKGVHKRIEDGIALAEKRLIPATA